MPLRLASLREPVLARAEPMPPIDPRCGETASRSVWLTSEVPASFPYNPLLGLVVMACARQVLYSKGSRI
jgi:hypothetical protein